MLNRLLIFCASSALVSTLSVAARGQLPIPRPSIVGGITDYKLGDSLSSGTSAIGALRIDVPLMAVVAEGSLGLFRATEENVHRTYMIPEVQAQYQFFQLLVRPYVGVGIGWLHPFSSSPTGNRATYSGSLGVRAGIPLSPVAFRAEVRTRTVGSSFNRHATELTVGFRW
ncbi:MAG TPA: hypothetical protein VH559_08435 [Gemmatimonadaceae bacterium]